MQLLKFMLAQMLGLLLALLLLHLAHIPGLWPLVLAQAVAAAGCSRALRQPAWWMPIHLLFAPAGLAMLALHLPPSIYLLAALVLVLVFWGTVKGDVPLFLSSNAVTDALKKIVDQEQAGTLIDLGAGIGSVAVPLARHRPGMWVEAWERAPIPWAIAAWRCRGLANTRVLRRSFWTCDLSPYDMAYAFLSPAAMPQLGEKVLRKLRPGSLFVSSSFPVPAWEPESIVQLEDSMATRLYCYRIK
jgi:hypothetical protein